MPQRAERRFRALVFTYTRLQQLLDFVFGDLERYGKLFHRAAMGFFEHAHVVAARFLVVPFGLGDAVPHGLGHAHRCRRALLEELLEMALFKRAVALGERVAFHLAVMIDDALRFLAGHGGMQPVRLRNGIQHARLRMPLL